MGIVSGIYKHRFLGTDTETEKIVEFDENGNITWEYHAGLTVFDIWQLPEDGNILYCHYGHGCSGARIINRKGDILHQYSTENEIFSCQPLENGNILVGELRQKRLVEADRDGNIVKTIPLKYDNDDNLHEVMRSMRKMSDGTYLMVSPGLKKLVRMDDTGKIVWEADTRHDTFGAVERPNGNIVYSCMDGLGEIDKSGKEIWSLYPQDCPEINILWLLGIQLRENGNIVCCNWLGHGHNGEGVPMFEVTPDKKVVWQCDCREISPNLGNFYLLDDASDSDICYKPLR